jgi:beta-ureidopropionase / N-carbamoyl-L-amino-acid hydrolase
MLIQSILKLTGKYMSDNYHNLTINEYRFEEDFEELSKIGKIGKTGVNRPVFSEAFFEARDWFREKAQQAGLESIIDSAGNHIMRYPCEDPDAPSFLLGSHLDSVPNGGRYDGALGVLAALEVLRRISELGIKLPIHLEALDFSDEEGTLVSFLGSFAITGMLDQSILIQPRGGRERFLDALHRAGLKEDEILNAKRDPDSFAGYLELHIEQGPFLEQSGHQIGIVQAIAGIAFYRLRFIGRADHAGTISMQDRLDAAQGASAFTLSVRKILLRDFPHCKANVGNATVIPGAFNIVPEVVALDFECRADDLEIFEKIQSILLDQARLDAERFGLGLEVEFLGKRDPVAMDTDLLSVIQKASDHLALSSQRITSWAGHDAQAMADVCPTAMIFIPSIGGTSHSPDEFSRWEDCVNGANVLLQATLMRILGTNF